jgi:pentatricopeptide repeat protein
MNALIAACGRGGRPDLALAVLNDMEFTFRVTPDHRSFRSAVMACTQAEKESRLYQKQTGLEIDNEAEDDETEDDEAEDDEAEDDEAEDSLEDQKYLPSIEWWEYALSLLRRMQESGLTPDIQTYSSVISACESAGQWQRALGVLQAMMETDSDDNDSTLNLYCFNAAISACEKGGAWIEALELYERMIDQGGSLTPTFVTLNSLVVALQNAGQKELAQSKYEQGQRKKIVNPWRKTKDKYGKSISAMVSLSVWSKRCFIGVNVTGPSQIFCSNGSISSS